MSIATQLEAVRKKAMLTLAQVAEKAELGLSTLSEFENGKREPSAAQLVKLARFFHLPVGYFFGETELPSEKILWRHRPASPAAEDTEARFLELCSWYQNLEEWTKEKSKVGVARIDVPNGILTRRDIIKLAERCRGAYELGTNPTRTLLSALEDGVGVKIFHLPLGPAGNAASAVGEFGMAVLLNSDNNQWQRAFDLAHELYHLITWRDRCAKEVTDPAEEIAADRFAAHLLVPLNRLMEVFTPFVASGKIGPTDLSLIARRFEVPVEAIIRVLGDQFSMDEATLEELVQRCRVLDRGIDVPSDKPPERPARFRNLAIKAYHMRSTSTSMLAKYLGIKVAEAMNLLRSSIKDGEEIRFT